MSEALKLATRTGRKERWLRCIETGEEKALSTWAAEFASLNRAKEANVANRLRRAVVRGARIYGLQLVACEHGAAFKPKYCSLNSDWCELPNGHAGKCDPG